MIRVDHGTESCLMLYVQDYPGCQRFFTVRNEDNNGCRGIIEAKDASGKNLWNTCAAFTVCSSDDFLSTFEELPATRYTFLLF